MKTTAIISTLTLIFVLASCSSHTMEDGSSMSGSAHEETVATHQMEDGAAMSGATHEDSETHTMDDGSKMDGATHESTMDETESQ